MLFLFIFNHQEWSRLYQLNCSLNLTDEWTSTSTPNVFIGILYMMIGIVCEIIYIPFMIIMIRQEFIQYYCYKFMFLLGIVDMIILPSNSIVSGIQSILGLNYCSNPKFYYVIGVISTSGWYGAGMTCCLLAINRFFEMLAPRIAKILFSGKQIYIWLAIPLLYTIFTFSQVEGVYNTKYYAFNFPFFGETDWELMKMTYQSMCICVEMFVAAIVYVFNQFIPLPHFLLIIAHACWICVHGDTPIVYLILNKTLRKAVFDLVLGIIKNSPPGTNINTTMNYFHRSSLQVSQNGGERRRSSAQSTFNQAGISAIEKPSVYSIEPNNE